jgi:RNA polymerase sigma-70 factor (ECF subfamily)
MVTAPINDLDLRIATRQAIGELGERQRLVVMLRYFAELSVPEIARILSWREGTVKSRLHRALQELRRKLEPEMAPEMTVELRPQQKEEV